VGAAEARQEERQGHFHLDRYDQNELHQLISLLREELGDESFEVLAAEGRAMTQERTIAYALEKSE
jgi:hypothetical protein